MGFKVLAKEVREKFKASVEGPLEYVKNSMKVRLQSSPAPDYVFSINLIISPARGFFNQSHPIVCLAWRVVRKRLSMKKSYEMYQVSYLAVSLFRKSIHLYSCFSLLTIGAAATVCRDGDPPWAVTSLTMGLDKVGLEDVHLRNDHQPRSDEESARRTGSGRWQGRTPGFLS